MATGTDRIERYGRRTRWLHAAAYLTTLLLLGTGLISTAKIPAWLGLWWVHLPMLALAAWLFLRDGRVPGPPRP